jgi:phospho-N-acetylmuramoyl-pentapeptide-transferase
LVRKELHRCCVVFLVENLSVVIQVILNTLKNALAKAKNLPDGALHHHYQKKGYHESKIVIDSGFVAMLTFLMLL